MVIHIEAITGSDVPILWWWVGVFFALYYLPDLFTVGFSRPWGRWPQLAALTISIALLAADFAAFGSGWAPPLGWGIFVFSAFYYGVIGTAFLLTAFFAVPG